MFSKTPVAKLADVSIDKSACEKTTLLVEEDESVDEEEKEEGVTKL